MRDIVITSEELKMKDSSVLPQKADEFANYTFWYYTSLQTADKILKGKTIYISNINKMNDLDEIVIHEQEKELVHCLCFCNSNTEKIPMWYLYAGITGKGVSIGFTPSVMMRFLNSIETAYTVEDEIKLERGKDFDLKFGWVFYRKKEEPSQVMHKGTWYTLRDPENFDQNNYFVKAYPWEYEKEFRIVFHNKTGKPYDRIKVSLETVYSKLKIKLAPELSMESFEEKLKNLPGFLKYMSSVPLHSNLGINMDLCKRNFDGFIDYVEADFRRKQREIESSKIDRICAIIQSDAKCATCPKDATGQ